MKNSKIKLKIVLIYFLLLFSLGCENKDAPLYEVILKIEKSFNKKDLQQFSSLEENKTVTDLHFTVGLRIRDEILRDKKDSTLFKFFVSKGIYHLDDMSSIIIKSLHRKLNDKNINLKQQIKEKIDYRRPYEQCELLKRKFLKKNSTYKIGDSVQIRLRVNTMDNSAYPIVCLNMQPDWKFDNEKDLLIRGIVLDKYSIEDIPENKFMKIKIVEINKKNSSVNGRVLKVSDFYELVLNYNIIESW